MPRHVRKGSIEKTSHPIDPEKRMNLFQLLQVNLTKLAKNQRGQDLIEYALMAGFVAVAAGAVMPGVSTSISTIFSQIASVMTVAGSQS
jgi:Flp pilus assembly pilin Flp